MRNPDLFRTFSRYVHLDCKTNVKDVKNGRKLSKIVENGLNCRNFSKMVKNSQKWKKLSKIVENGQK